MVRWMDGLTDGWMYAQIFPVFYWTSPPLGPLPCLLQNRHSNVASRARLPLTIYCLWATGFSSMAPAKFSMAFGWRWSKSHNDADFATSKAGRVKNRQGGVEWTSAATPTAKRITKPALRGRQSKAVTPTEQCCDADKAKL